MAAKSGATLDKLRALKSEVEGTHYDYVPTTANEAALQDLKTLMLMHIPTSVTEDVRQKFEKLILSSLSGHKKIIFGCLMTCPWYQSTQPERGQQAKHNMIFIVFVSTDEQFFSTANQHVRDQNHVIDLGWFLAVEIFHFAHYLTKGKMRFIEALLSSRGATGSLLYQTDDWSTLKNSSLIEKLLGLRGFLEQCRGQSIGGVAKKRKNGSLGLKDTATQYDLCESLRLLHYGVSALTEHVLHTSSLDRDKLPEVGQQGLDLITRLYQDEDVTRQDVFQLILRWKSDLDELMKTHKFTKIESVDECIRDWLMHVRAGPNPSFRKICVEKGQEEYLGSLKRKVGGHVEAMKPEQILMVAQAGSKLYDLATPDSDVDFVIIYAEPIEKILGTSKRLNECDESRGPKKQFEYGSYEARLFCEMLLKGSVVILELLFADDLEYTSAAWKELSSHKELFVTERAILQYFGLIKNNMIMIENEKHRGTKREGKLFYQIFHKLNSLEYFLAGKPPVVKCSGSARDFIMRIRTGPLEGDISRENLYTLAQEKILNMRTSLANRTKRLPENGDYSSKVSEILQNSQEIDR
ncbi:unnamed protein product [Owenia fusiformis]|uniref:Uncharacterized protein n=1 Tax=Owenia fusiformis TaxID=6347 RepID=A0A8J1TUM9_OWEFU|nr:unnamed protein product [Owenia fusiformis]